MIEVTLLVPLSDNDGATFTAPHHASFEAVLLDHFGGFTRLPGNAKGGWLDSKTGRIYFDESILYMVGVGGLVGNGALREVVRLAKLHYRQEAILLRYLGVAEVI